MAANNNFTPAQWLRIILIGAVLLITAIAVTYWKATKDTNEDAELKQQLIENKRKDSIIAAKIDSIKTAFDTNQARTDKQLQSVKQPPRVIRIIGSGNVEEDLEILNKTQ